MVTGSISHGEVATLGALGSQALKRTPSAPSVSQLGPGMSAGVDILTKSEEGIISVPIEAVTTREKETDDKEAAGTDNLQEVVFVISGDTVRQQSVTTGVQDANVIQIKTGLEEGDKVVSGPYTELSRKLKEGKKVIVKDKDTFYSEDKD